VCVSEDGGMRWRYLSTPEEVGFNPLFTLVEGEILVLTVSEFRSSKRPLGAFHAPC